MKYKKSVFKSLALITQLGISMIVPIAMCVALGLWLDNRFGIHTFIPLMILGMLAGGRNVYRMAMAASKDDDGDTGKSDLTDKGRKERHDE